MVEASRGLELEVEKRLLIKVDADIGDGWRRLHRQQELLASLRSSGQSLREAERLVGLLKRTLLEWGRHRVLIEQRVAYLEERQSAYPRANWGRAPGSEPDDQTDII